MAKKSIETSTGKLSLAEKLRKLKQQTEKINTAAGKTVAGFIDSPEIAERLLVKYIPTPNDDLNEALGGGWAVGRLNVITGKEDSGKTSIILETIGQRMRADESFVCLWLESENSLELSYITKTFGIDPARFLLIAMDLKEGAELVLDQCEAYLRTGTVDMFVINSLKALVPKVQLNKPVTEDTVAMQARLNTKALNKYVSIVKEHDICFIVVQHLTTPIGGVMTRDLIMGGGLFLKYACSICIDMRKVSVQPGDIIDKTEGQRYSITVRKNHVTPRRYPYVRLEHLIVYDEGTEVILTTLKKAVEQGIIKQSGAWLMWDEYELRWQGKAKFREYMKEHPDQLQTLRNLVVGNIIDLTEDELKEMQINPEDDLAPVPEGEE